MLLLSLCLTAAIFCGCGKTSADSDEQSDISAAASFAEKESSQAELSDTSVAKTETSTASASESSAEQPDLSVIEFLEYKHFVPRLDPDEMKAFVVLYRTALQFGEEASFPSPLPEDVFERLMWYLNYDCPELIHVTGDYRPVYQGDAVIGAGLYYNMQPEDYTASRQSLNDYFKRLRDDTKDMTSYEKEKYVFDRIFSETVFDEAAPHAGSVYGTLIEHRARCEGISKAFAWCMNELGLECMTVAGTPLWDNDALYASHSWNILRLEGQYYQVDIAADNVRYSDDETTVPLYAFLNSDDKQMAKSRIVNEAFEKLGVPACSSTEWNYHVRGDLLMAEGADRQTRFREILDKHFVSGQEKQISIRFDKHEEYRSFLSEWEDWFNAYLTERSYPDQSNHIYYNDAADTMVLCIGS